MREQEYMNTKQTQRTTAALRRLAVYLPGKQCDPRTVTDVDLCSALASLVAATAMTRSATYTIHSLIRTALNARVPDGRTRWPVFWTKGRCCRWLTGKEICLANTLPYRLIQLSDIPLIRIPFERAAARILLRTSMQRPSTGRKVFAFLWGFVVHPSSISNIPYLFMS